VQSFDEQLIQLAQQQRLLTRKQAELMRNELSNNPSLDVSQMMLQKHYLTEDQLFKLSDQVHQQAAAEGSSPDDTAEHAIGLPDSYDTVPKPSSIDAAETNAEGLSPQQRDAMLEQQRQAVEQGQEFQSAAPTPGQPDFQQGPITETTAPVPSEPLQEVPSLGALLRLARHWGSSDLHLNVGRPPFVRLHGQIRYMEMEDLTEEKSGELNFSALSETQQAVALHNRQLEFALEIPNVGRHRCSVFKDHRGWCGSYHIISLHPSSLSELKLPETLASCTTNQQGLVIVAGPAGSGKTSTVAALLQLFNQQQRGHIITIEDPIEILLPPQNCQITQREIERHTASLPTAYQAALSQDPDVIFIGELRNKEAISLALSAAQTGHLVFSTMNSGSTTRVVSRLIDNGTNQQACSLVAENLKSIITQKLIPRRDQPGQALAVEILLNTSEIAQQINEGKTHLLQSLIQHGKAQGMMLMDESLVALLKNGTISGRNTYIHCINKSAFEQVMNQD
jgi:twitching motility protein PilT